MIYVVELALSLLVVVPIFFVWNEVYQDGFFGRLALIGISFSSVIFLIRIIGLGISHLWPESELLIISFAGFICWHLWRFHRRVLTAERAKRHEIERRSKERIAA